MCAGARPLAESKPVLLKSSRGNHPAKRIGLHITVCPLSRAILASAPPVPPSRFDEVASLNHLEPPFALGFCAVPGQWPVPLQLGNIFTHAGI